MAVAMRQSVKTSRPASSIGSSTFSSLSYWPFSSSWQLSVSPYFLILFLSFLFYLPVNWVDDDPYMPRHLIRLTHNPRRMNSPPCEWRWKGLVKMFFYFLFFYLMFYFLPLTKKEAMQRSIYTAFADTHTFGLIERVHMRPPLFYFFFLASQQWPSEQSL